MDCVAPPPPKKNTSHDVRLDDEGTDRGRLVSIVFLFFNTIGQVGAGTTRPSGGPLTRLGYAVRATACNRDGVSGINVRWIPPRAGLRGGISMGGGGGDSGGGEVGGWHLGGSGSGIGGRAFGTSADSAMLQWCVVKLARRNGRQGRISPSCSIVPSPSSSSSSCGALLAATIISARSAECLRMGKKGAQSSDVGRVSDRQSSSSSSFSEMISSSPQKDEKSSNICSSSSSRKENA